MGFKLAMPQFLSAKPEPSALAQTHARLKAWWDGAPAPKFEVVPRADEAMTMEGSDPPAHPATNPSSATAVTPTITLDNEQIGVLARARAAIWADGRCYPSTELIERQLLDEVFAARASRIALFCSGGGAIGTLIGNTMSAKVEIFESDDVTQSMVEALLKATKHAKRFRFHHYAGAPGSLPKNKVEAALFLFQGTHKGQLGASAFGAERLLKSGGRAVWFDFFARRDNDTLDEYRGAENRYFDTEDEAVSAFLASGLSIEADDDWSARFLDGFETAWRDLAVNLAVRQGVLVQQGGQAAGSAALEDLIVWKARAEAVRTGKLTARRYLLKN